MEVSQIIGLVLIGVGLLDIGVGIVIAAILALRRQPQFGTEEGLAPQNIPWGKIPWKEVLEFAKELLKAPGGVLFLTGAAMVVGGVYLMDEKPF